MTRLLRFLTVGACCAVILALLALLRLRKGLHQRTGSARSLRT